MAHGPRVPGEQPMGERPLNAGYMHVMQRGIASSHPVQCTRPHGVSTVRGARNADDADPVWAPWSLLRATR